MPSPWPLSPPSNFRPKLFEVREGPLARRRGAGHLPGRNKGVPERLRLICAHDLPFGAAGSRADIGDYVVPPDLMGRLFHRHICGFGDPAVAIAAILPGKANDSCGQLRLIVANDRLPALGRTGPANL